MYVRKQTNCVNNDYFFLVNSLIITKLIFHLIFSFTSICFSNMQVSPTSTSCLSVTAGYQYKHKCTQLCLLLFSVGLDLDLDCKGLD